MQQITEYQPMTAPVATDSNMLASGALIDADSDRQAVGLWLADYAGTPNTLSSYRKEADRFLLWMNHHHMNLNNLSREAVLQYRAFLANPTERWVSEVRYARTDPRWKPFSGPLSKASIRQAEVILSHLYSWLTKAGYVKSNPFALTSRRIRTGSPLKSMLHSVVERHLDQDTWHVVAGSIDSMPAGTDRLLMLRERCRWIMTLLKLTGMRVTEAITITLGSFRESSVTRKNRETGQKVVTKFWMLDVVGKGSKPRKIPVVPELLQAARDYCDIMDVDFDTEVKNRSSLPAIMPVNGSKSEHLTRAALHLIIKQIFARAHTFADDDHQREKLSKASCHWMRHTAGSTMANNGTDVRVIQQVLGHASLETSSIYLHLEDDLALYDGVTKGN